MGTVEPLHKAVKKKKRRLPRMAASAVLLAAVSAAAVFLIDGGALTSGGLGLSALLKWADGGDGPREFSFDAGSLAAFAELGGGLAVCSSAELQVLGKNSEVKFREPVGMAAPVMCAGGASAAVYDAEGQKAVLFDLRGVKKRLETKGKIISASVGGKGCLALCTQEAGYKGLVTVFDSEGNEVYKWYSAKGYVMSAQVSPDGKWLAVLTLNEEGSRVVFFSLDSPEEKASCTLGGELILDIRHAGSDVMAVGQDALFVVHRDGGSDKLFDYTGKYLAGYALGGDGFAALALHDYLVGEQGQIVTVGRSGEVLGQLAVERKVLKISSRGDYLAVLYGDGLAVYDKRLRERLRRDDTAGAVGVSVREDGSALLVMPRSAVVCQKAP